MLAASRNTNALLGSIEVILVCVALIVVFGGAYWVINTVYDKVPEWRLHPKPGRQLRDARKAVKIAELHRKKPWAFEVQELQTPGEIEANAASVLGMAYRIVPKMTQEVHGEEGSGGEGVTSSGAEGTS